MALVCTQKYGFWRPNKLVDGGVLEENAKSKDSHGEMKLRKSLRSWTLALGVLVILGACIGAYISTRPAEADVSKLVDSPKFIFSKSASVLFCNV